MKVFIKLAHTPQDVLRCQYLIAQIYNEAYGVFFSEDRYDLTAKIEPWPHRFVMGLVDGQLACAAGLYLKDTYVERFGDIQTDELTAALETAGLTHEYDPARKREYTKLVVHRKFRQGGLGRFFLAASHSHCFIDVDASAPHFLVGCARLSIFERAYDRAGIHTRTLKPFPYYKVHELYRSADDPMESRVVFPSIDIPRRWYDLQIPGEYEVDTMERRP
jgi:hypothetical protein